MPLPETVDRIDNRAMSSKLDVRYLDAIDDINAALGIEIDKLTVEPGEPLSLTPEFEQRPFRAQTSNECERSVSDLQQCIRRLQGRVHDLHDRLQWLQRRVHDMDEAIRR